MISKKIDEFAVNKVKDLITKSEYLSAENIEYRGTTPCYDGDIVLFKNKEHSKKDGTSTVRIQIKGKMMGIFPDEIKFSNLNHGDLLTYKNDSGVLYFVVGVKNNSKDINKDCMLYCKVLFRNEIIEIINKKQKTYTMQLKKINDHNELLDIVNYFVNNRDPMMYPLIKTEDFSKYQIKKFSVTNLRIAGNIIKISNYSTLNIEINDVVRSVDLNLIEMKMSKFVFLEIENREYKSEINFEFSKNGDKNITKISAGIIISQIKDKNNVRININNNMTFYELYITCLIANAVNERKPVLINGIQLFPDVIQFGADSKEFFNVSKIIISLYRKLIELKIIIEVNLHDILSKLEMTQKFLSILDNDQPKFTPLNIQDRLFTIVEVLNLKFLIYKEVDKQLSERFSLPLINYDQATELVANFENKKIKLPIIMILKDWSKTNNKYEPIFLSQYYFDKELLVNDLIRYLNLDNISYYNNFGICLLNGFDENGDLNSLEIAKFIFEKSNELSNESYILINYEQAKLRANESLDINSLQTIIDESKKPALLKFACNVILGNIDESELIYTNLETEQQVEIIGTPIMNLFNKYHSTKKI